MTTQTLNGFSFPNTLLARAAGIFAALARAISLAKNAEVRFEEIQMLQALSDEDLARRGIARDTIVRHVYADLLAD